MYHIYTVASYEESRVADINRPVDPMHPYGFSAHTDTVLKEVSTSIHLKDVKRVQAKGKKILVMFIDGETCVFELTSVKEANQIHKELIDTWDTYLSDMK